MTFKNDQYTAQSLVVLHDAVNLKGLVPFKQYVFKTKEEGGLLDLPENSISGYSDKKLNDMIGRSEILFKVRTD